MLCKYAPAIHSPSARRRVFRCRARAKWRLRELQMSCALRICLLHPPSPRVALSHPVLPSWLPIIPAMSSVTLQCATFSSQPLFLYSQLLECSNPPRVRSLIVFLQQPLAQQGVSSQDFLSTSSPLPTLMPWLHILPILHASLRVIASSIQSLSEGQLHPHSR